MPRISLRTYEKDIEEMIERNQLNEAVAHCKHILQFFPKNISTYRILGKAFLEAKQYKETADIFTRVLTVYPDDFIAHAGMSIVQELEKNLDAAIWHMQMAFDSQPSNIAIQEELKRLFDLRDGTHPDKIRLTRGALVRMYARGELFQQAIDEIKSALSEEPKRIDLQVYLAKMYFLSGDQEEALSISERLITDFPYCYELNRILVNILKNLGGGKKAEVFTGRLVELNPYQAFVNDIYTSEEQVPDEKVVIDRLVDTSAMPLPVSTNWSENETYWQPPVPEQALPAFQAFPGTAELHIDEDKESLTTKPQIEAELPQKEEINMSASTTPFEDPTPLGDDSENSIPDWMRNSGWVPSNGEADSAQESSHIPEETADPVPADMPDWLKSLSQDDSLPVVNENSEEAKPEPDETTAPSPFSDTSAWMNDIIAENTPSKDKEDSDLPDWLKNFETDDKVEPVAKDDLPGWLNALKSDEAPLSSNPLADPTIEETDMAATPSSSHVENEDVDPLTNLFSADASTWQPAEDILEERPSIDQPQAAVSPVSSDEDSALLGVDSIAATPEPVDPNATISQETEDDLLSWLRDLKPAESEENDSPVSEAVPEESLENEDQRYDFAAQLERLKNINEETTVPEENVEPIVVQDQGIEPIPTDLVESVPSQPVTESVETASIETEVESVLPTFEPVPDLVEEVSIPDIQSVSPAEESAADKLLEEDSEDAEFNKPELGLEALRQAAEANSEDYFSWQKLGDAYAKEGNLIDALAAYNKAESILINSK
ncbi:MAG: hypothetical protein VB013_01940 [Anaerolineaceae bacterium]|nr:hypothetical protein [Anaerolineaceae bacterium]